MRTSRNRRRILIDGLQYRLLAINFLHVAGAIFVAYAVIFAPVAIDVLSERAPDVQQEEASRQFLVLHARVWLALPVVVLFFLVHSVFVSHRIAGPLYRLRSVFGEVERGSLTSRIQLRRGDYLSKEEAAVNEMIEGLARRVVAAERRYREAGEAVEELTGAIDREHGDGLRVLAARLEVRMGELGRAFEGFDVPREEPRKPRIEDREPLERPAAGSA